MGDILNIRRMIATGFILSASLIAIVTATSHAMGTDTIEIRPLGHVHVDDSGATFLIQSEKPCDVIVIIGVVCIITPAG